MYKLLIITLLVVSLSACQKTVSYKEIPGSDYLSVKNSDFDRVIIRDKSIIDQYNKVIFSQLNFDALEILSSRNKKIDRTWALDDNDKKIFSGYLKNEILTIFDGNNSQELFGLATKKAPKTLFAEVRLLKFKPMVAKHGQDLTGTISIKSTESFGSLIIQIILVDSVSSEFVAVLEDSRDLALGSTERSSVNKFRQAYVWKKAFNGWLKELKTTLTQLKQI